MVTAFQERRTFNPEKAPPWSEGELCHVPGPLNQRSELPQAPFTANLETQSPQPGFISLSFTHLKMARASSMEKPGTSGKLEVPPSLSPLAISRAWNDWFLNVTQFVGHAIYIICWLNWERTIAVCLNLSWTKAVCQIDSYGWTINSSQIFQNGYVGPQLWYLGTEIKGMQ